MVKIIDERKIKESRKSGEQEEIVVKDKAWGKEYWIVNREYCGKVLSLNKGYRCSMHYHKEKDETFLIISGKVLMEADGKKWIMEPGHSQYIKPGCMHRFSGLEDSQIIEFSTHHDENDSYRKEPSGKIPG